MSVLLKRQAPYWYKIWFAALTLTPIALNLLIISSQRTGWSISTWLWKISSCTAKIWDKTTILAGYSSKPLTCVNQSRVEHGGHGSPPYMIELIEGGNVVLDACLHGATYTRIHRCCIEQRSDFLKFEYSKQCIRFRIQPRHLSQTSQCTAHLRRPDNSLFVAKYMHSNLNKP